MRHRWLVGRVADVEALEGRETSHGPLRLADVRAGRFPEERDIQLTAGEETLPVAEAKYFAGRPEAGAPPWIEAAIACQDEDLLVEVVAALADLLPAGGRLMLVYAHGETQRLLLRGVPAAATPLGAALLAAGFTWFKDWYFAEGGREGETKLQGNKPPSHMAGQWQLARVREALRAWLDGVPDDADPELAQARERAEAILEDEPRAMTPGGT